MIIDLSGKGGSSVNSTFEELWGRAIREGLNHGYELTSSGVVPNSSSTLTLGSLQGISITEVYLIESVIFSLTGGYATFQLAMGTGPDNGSSSTSFRVAVNNNAISIPLKRVSPPGVTGTVFLSWGDGTSTVQSRFAMSAYRMTADLNFNAKKTILWIGDSITRGTSIGGTGYNAGSANLQTCATPEDHFAFQVRNHFQRKGTDCRLIIKAMGSYGSKDWEACRKLGWLDVGHADVIFYQLGVNDTSQSTTDQQFTDNINAVIDHRNRKWPKAKIVLVGDTPLNNNTNETRLAQLRTIKSNIATANSANEVYYVNLASVFDRTVLTNYNASDGTHPNIASNLLIGNAFKSWIDSTNFNF